MYTLHIFPKDKRALKKISFRHQKAIIAVLEELQDNPFLGKPLERELTGSFTYRVGVYRIIYKIKEKDKIMIVLNAGHRSTIYK